MKKKTILSIIVWLAALVCCLVLADKAVRRDDGARKYDSFFAEKQDVDVLFLGTSRVLDGITPMELWRDHGVTSYNMGNSSEPLGVTEQVLRLSLNYHVPKIAVIDVFYVKRGNDDAWTYPYRHMFLDEIPFSMAKFDAVRATLPKDQWQEFMIPFSLYHGRWEEILAGGVERMVDCERYMMGSEMRIGTFTRTDFTRTQESTQEKLPGHDALASIAALCRENGIEPVFVALPGYASHSEQMEMNSVQAVADALDVPFVNMMDVPDVINYDTDCYDWNGHLNPSGASRTTAYLGEWLTQHYPLEDKRQDPAFAHWNENLEKYEAYREAVWPGA